MTDKHHARRAGDDAADERTRWLAEHYIDPAIRRAFADGEARWTKTFKDLLNVNGGFPKRIVRLEKASEWLVLRILVLATITSISVTAVARLL